MASSHDTPAGPADDGKPPKFGVGKPAAEGGPLPRVIDQLERATKGTRRFKVRVDGYTPATTRYVLTADGPDAEKDARQCYAKAQRLDEHLARIKKGGGKVEEPQFAVTALAD
jgi:hypothetical protein